MAVNIEHTRISEGGIRYDSLSGAGWDVLTDATITASGESGYFHVAGARQIDVLIAVASASGASPTLQFTLVPELINTLDPVNFIDVGAITGYAGTSLTTAGVDGITVSNNLIGDYVKVIWTVGGTNPVFAGVFVRLVQKK